MVYVPGKVDYDRFLRQKKDNRMKLLQNPKVKSAGKSCCDDVNNLRYAPWLNNRLDLVTLKCKKCGATHRHAALESGRHGIRTSEKTP